ncbi:hypothetical protein [Candidatus Magnetaquiglobus chichijimensis]|uniref:hypothetical protein n=1 Tax=Candidatus Magnetaquiglobus chichijimensis TaxID=3141448 RepID=UPI003B97914A
MGGGIDATHPDQIGNRDVPHGEKQTENNQVSPNKKGCSQRQLHARITGNEFQGIVTTRGFDGQILLVWWGNSFCLIIDVPVSPFVSKSWLLTIRIKKY